MVKPRLKKETYVGVNLLIQDNIKKCERYKLSFLPRTI